MAEEIPKGFVRFFDVESDVPASPPGPPDERLVTVKSATIVYHCASVMSRDVGLILSSEILDSIETKTLSIFKNIAPLISKKFDLDRYVYTFSGRNFRQLIFGPINLTVSVEPDLHLDGTAYLLMTIYDSQVVVISLIIPIGTKGEFNTSSRENVTAESIRKMIRIYFEDLEGFTINGESVKPTTYLKDILSVFTSANSGLKSVENWAFRRLTVYIWETEPDFKGKSMSFARSHAHECLAMVGEAEDWRKKSPETLINYMPYVMISSPNDLEIPCPMVSLVFHGEPINKQEYEKWYIGPYTLLDVHLAAASAAFKASWMLIDYELPRVAKLKEAEYVNARNELTRLYFHYRVLKNRFYNTDHFWTDSAYRELVNATLKQLDYTKSSRVEELEKNAESLNDQADRLSQAISQKRQLDMSKVLGFFGGLLAVRTWLDIVPSLAEASLIPVVMKPYLSILGSLIVTIIIGVVYFGRD